MCNKLHLILDKKRINYRVGSMKTQTKSPFLGLVLAVTVLILILLLLEGIFQLYDWSLSLKYGQTNAAAFLQEYQPTRGWANKSGAEKYFIHKKSRIKTHVRINSQGLRDDEVPLERDTKKLRILILGDSVVAGFEVEKNETLDRVSEALLSKYVDPEVINAGTRGYGTDQSYLYFKEKGKNFKPDMVLYVFVNNDLENNTIIHRAQKEFGKSYFVMNPKGELELKGVPVPKSFEPNDKNLYSSPVIQDFYDQQNALEEQSRALKRIRDFFYEHSFFFQWFVARLHHFNKSIKNRNVAQDESAVTSATKPEIVVREEWKITEKLIAAMKKTSEEIGARFVVMEFSNGSELTAPPPQLQQVTTKLGIPLIQTHQSFKAAKDGTYYSRNDAHWNARGHHLAAEILFTYLTHEGWELMRDKVVRR